MSLFNLYGERSNFCTLAGEPGLQKVSANLAVPYTAAWQ